jgi:hypothetical protein
VCWIKPNNIVVNQLFGVNYGLAMGMVTFGMCAFLPSHSSSSFVFLPIFLPPSPFPSILCLKTIKTGLASVLFFFYASPPPSSTPRLSLPPLLRLADARPTDWAQITYIGSPLATPWWAEANIAVGFVFFFWILTPALYVRFLSLSSLSSLSSLVSSSWSSYLFVGSRPALRADFLFGT